MSQGRMISREIYNSDRFLDLPATTQLLYTHLVARANDDLFVRKARYRLLMTILPFTDVDFKLLIFSGFITLYKNGVCVTTNLDQVKKARTSRCTQPVHVDEPNCSSLDTSKKIF